MVAILFRGEIKLRASSMAGLEGGKYKGNQNEW